MLPDYVLSWLKSVAYVLLLTGQPDLVLLLCMAYCTEYYNKQTIDVTLYMYVQGFIYHMFKVLCVIFLYI